MCATSSSLSSLAEQSQKLLLPHRRRTCSALAASDVEAVMYDVASAGVVAVFGSCVFVFCERLCGGGGLGAAGALAPSAPSSAVVDGLGWVCLGPDVA